MSDKFQLKAIISAVDKITPTLKGIQRSVRLTSKTMRDVSRASGDLFSKIGLSSVALGGGLAFAVKKIVGVSAEFERYRTILETIEGSSAKAQKSMDWVQDFAVKTPYELSQVTDAFVKLKAYGIDPQGGALAAAGDAASAMGKNVMQAVEALADAMTGENERLKEFGITAQKRGDLIKYNWTENGELMSRKAKASSREMIETTINWIWNRQFGGAMNKRASTWEGMWSNMMDIVTGFTKMIGDAGIFEAIKGQLQGLLDQFSKWKADGTLKVVAKEISDGLLSVLTSVSEWIKGGAIQRLIVDLKAFYVVVKGVVNMFGGLTNVLIAVGALLLSGPLAAIFSIVGSLWRFGAGLFAIIGGFAGIGKAMLMVGKIFAVIGRLFLLNPIGLAVTAIAGAAYLVYTNWDKIKGWFSEFFGWMSEKVAKIGKWLSDLLPDWARDMLGGGNVSISSQTSAQTPLIRSGALGVATRQQLTGDMTVRFENAPPGMRVDQGRTNMPGVAMNPDVGYRGRLGALAG